MSLSRAQAYRVVVFLVGCSYAAYSIDVAYDLPFADHWRFLRESLIPFLHGDLTLPQYVLSEYRPLSHKHVLTLLHLLLNYRVFHLDYRVECYVGLLSALAIFVVLSLSFLRSTQGVISSTRRWFVLMLLALAFLNPMNVVAWSLVQFEYLYLLFVVVLFWAFDSSSDRAGRGLLLWGAAALAYVTCDAANFTAVLALGLLVAVFGDRAQRRKLVGPVVAFVLLFGLMHLVLSASGLPQKSSNRVTLSFDAGNLPEAFDFFAFAYAQPVLDHVYFREALGASWPWVFGTLGIVFGGFAAASLWIYVRHRERLRLSSVPALLVLFGFLSALGILLSRLSEFGAEVALSDRYMRLFDLGLVGSLWIHMVSASARATTGEPSMPRRPWTKVALTVATLCVAGGFAVSTVGRWAYVDQIIAKKVQLRDALYRYSEDEGFPIGAVHSACADGLCREPIEFLRAERLSFFRDEPSLRHGTTPNEKR